MLQNSADWLAVSFGVLKAGAVATTISSLLTGHEFSNLINHAKPRVVYIDETKPDALQRIRRSAGAEKAICRDGDMDLAAVMATGSPSFRSGEKARSSEKKCADFTAHKTNRGDLLAAPIAFTVKFRRQPLYAGGCACS